MFTVPEEPVNGWLGRPSEELKPRRALLIDVRLGCSGQCDGRSATAVVGYTAVGKDTSAYPPNQPETSAADTRVAHTVLFFR